MAMLLLCDYITSSEGPGDPQVDVDSNVEGHNDAGKAQQVVMKSTPTPAAGEQKGSDENTNDGKVKSEKTIEKIRYAVPRDTPWNEKLMRLAFSIAADRNRDLIPSHALQMW
jgi:hypothetical protein